MAADRVPAPVDRPDPRPVPRPAKLFSDKRLMDNPEGDRTILRRARELADRRNDQNGTR